MNLDRLAEELHHTAIEKGFWTPLSFMEPQDDFIFYCKQLAMVHSEVTEVLEALRKDKGQDVVVEELADIIIRVLDLYAGLLNNDIVSNSLHKTVRNKAKVNKSRPKLHGVRG